ncbi:MAG: hypothetical protein Q9213_006251 [Squamulea squamosa]
MGPPKECNTTILKLKLSPGRYTVSVSDGGGEICQEIEDTSPEGQALLDFLTSVAQEPGHDYIMWARAREFTHCLFIFIELLTWVIPSSLDPTYHEAPAAQFEQLGVFIEYTQGMTTSVRPRDLSTSFRGWISGPREDKEPSEKTHLFVFVWEDAEAERRVKDGSPAESEYESWDKNFGALQREWEAKGMRCESLHLRMEDFKEQLR